MPFRCIGLLMFPMVDITLVSPDLYPESLGYLSGYTHASLVVYDHPEPPSRISIPTRGSGGWPMATLGPTSEAHPLVIDHPLVAYARVHARWPFPLKPMARGIPRPRLGRPRSGRFGSKIFF